MKRDLRSCFAILFALCFPLAFASLLGVARPVSAGRSNLNCDVTELINAINTANSNAGADTIGLARDCTYTLTQVNNSDPQLGPNGLPVITSEVTIEGNHATIARSSAEAALSFRLFQINPDAALTLKDLTLTGASAVGDGGAVHNRGTLNLVNSTLSHNKTECDSIQTPVTTGGAIYSLGTLAVQASTLQENASANCEPGGAPSGGGIANAGTMIVVDSTFSNNTQHISNSGTLDLSNSTLTDEAVGAERALAPRAPIVGFAIYNSGTAQITNITLSQNFGGYSLLHNAGALTLTNSIVTATASSFLCSGVITDGGGNLTWPPESNACVGKRHNPQLGEPADNGGSTPTMALAPNSPAINAAVEAYCPARDQRGISRPQGNHCDIGAFELEPPSAPTLVKPADGEELVQSKVKLKWTAAERLVNYQVIVRQDSPKGKKVINVQVVTTQVETPALESGHWYFWRIKACSRVKCTRSPLRTFHLQKTAAPPAPPSP